MYYNYYYNNNIIKFKYIKIVMVDGNVVKERRKQYEIIFNMF